MMLHVTIPMENAIKKVQDLKLLRSTTARGSCEMSAFMQWNSDIDLAKQRVEEQINSIKRRTAARREHNGRENESLDPSGDGILD